MKMRSTRLLPLGYPHYTTYFPFRLEEVTLERWYVLVYGIGICANFAPEKRRGT